MSHCTLRLVLFRERFKHIRWLNFNPLSLFFSFYLDVFFLLVLEVWRLKCGCYGPGKNINWNLYSVFIWKMIYLRVCTEYERLQLGMMFLHDQLQVCIVVVLQASMIDVCVCVLCGEQAPLITLRIGFHIDECPPGDVCVRKKMMLVSNPDTNLMNIYTRTGLRSTGL